MESNLDSMTLPELVDEIGRRRNELRAYEEAFRDRVDKNCQPGDRYEGQAFAFTVHENWVASTVENGRDQLLKRIQELGLASDMMQFSGRAAGFLRDHPDIAAKFEDLVALRHTRVARIVARATDELVYQVNGARPRQVA